MSLDDDLAPNAVRLGVPAAEWPDAVRAAGEALEAASVCTPDYTEQMVEVVERLGPYIVIAPGVALAHARPSAAVLRTGLSLVTLAAPVAFGSAANDPVSVVVGLAAVDHDAHLQTMSELATAIGDPDVVRAVALSTDPGTARSLLLGRTEVALTHPASTPAERPKETS